jgi:membrane protein implicated in regulation of membrane protease activity
VLLLWKVGAHLFLSLGVCLLLLQQPVIHVLHAAVVLVLLWLLRTAGFDTTRPETDNIQFQATSIGQSFTIVAHELLISLNTAQLCRSG